jgi:hypothetical protein
VSATDRRWRTAAVGATVLVVRRRLAARRGELLVTAGAVLVAAALVGAVGVVSTVSRQDYARQRLEAAGSRATALRAEVGSAPQANVSASRREVRRLLASFEDVASQPIVADILGPIAPRDERGTRFVAFRGDPAGVRVAAGRAPRSCSVRLCEALALTGGSRPGRRLVAGRVHVRVVGVARIEGWARPAVSLLGNRSFAVPAGTRLHGLARDATSWSAMAARLDPDRARSVSPGTLARRVEVMVARVRAAGLNTRATGPAPLLRSLDRRGDVAQRRMLLISAQAAVLLLAFVAFVASGRTGDARRADDQLLLLRAGRAQRLTVRMLEAAAPALAGTGLALGGTVAVGAVVAARRGLSASEMIGDAAGPATLAILAGLAVLAVVVVLGAEEGRQRAPGAIAPWEVAAAVALAALVWQTVSTGGLSADDVAAQSSPSPLLLLSPALAGLAGAAVLLRALPAILRAAERAGRGAGLGVRLALLGAARDRRRAAAAGVFVALTVGGAFFLLAYRATLAGQTGDAAGLRAAARWRGGGGAPAPPHAGDQPGAPQRDPTGASSPGGGRGRRPCGPTQPAAHGPGRAACRAGRTQRVARRLLVVVAR